MLYDMRRRYFSIVRILKKYPHEIVANESFIMSVMLPFQDGRENSDRDGG
jgi:hypothetical protein